MQRNRGIVFLFLFALTPPLFSEELTITPQELRIEQSLEGGYNLYVKKVEGLESILLTESTADPEKRAHSYALRNPEFHPANGYEKRILDGEFIEPGTELYSLIDSTPQDDEEFGEAFLVFIPYIVIYGYPWTREGEIQVLDGTWLNVRAFEKPYADYTGAFKDNPFVLKVVQKPEEGPPEGNYMADTVDNFKEIAEEGRGTSTLSKGHEEMLNEIEIIIDQAGGESLDLVLALDTTKSMEDDIPYLRDNLVPLLMEHTKRFDQLRVGLVLYRDYMEAYLTKIIPFRTGLAGLQSALNGIRVIGGRDIPEAVYEALYAGIHEFPWAAETRQIILIGDAPAHPRPRGSVTKEMVYQDANDLDIQLHTIILPH
jgi:hypothetical protein